MTVAVKIVHLVSEQGSTYVVCGGAARFVTSDPDAVTCVFCIQKARWRRNEANKADEAGQSLPVVVDHAIDELIVDDVADEPLAPTLEVNVPCPIRTAEDLHRWRKRHKLSLRALAPLLDTHWVTINRWERGLYPVPRVVELALNYLETTLPDAC